ncbi:hypothetical protein SALBM135S_01851 [Streptomyces alboniger]
MLAMCAQGAGAGGGCVQTRPAAGGLARRAHADPRAEPAVGTLSGLDAVYGIARRPRFPGPRLPNSPAPEAAIAGVTDRCAP